jgi:hypothetical protein
MGRSCGLRPPWLGTLGGQHGSDPGEIVGFDRGCGMLRRPIARRLEGMRRLRWGTTGHRARGTCARPSSTRCACCWAAGWAAQAAGDAGRGAAAGDATAQAAGRQRRGNGLVGRGALAGTRLRQRVGWAAAGPRGSGPDTWPDGLAGGAEKGSWAFSIFFFF